MPFPNMLKRIVLWGVTSLFVYEIGIAILKTVSNFSLGRLGKNFAIPLAIGLLLAFIIANQDRGITQILFGKSKISLRQVLTGLLIALPLGMVVPFVSVYDPTYVVVGIIVLAGFAFCLYLSVARDDVYGLGVFLVTLAFLKFLEWDFGSVFFPGDPHQVHTTYVLTPSDVFLWIFFAVTMAAQGIRRREWVRTRLNKYLLAFGLFLLLSSVASSDPMTSFKSFYREVAFSVLCFVLAVNRVRSKKDAVLLLYAIAIYGLLRVSIVYYFYLRIHEFSLSHSLSLYTQDVYAVVQHVGTIARFCMFMIPISISLFLLPSPWLRRSLFVGFTVFFVVILLLTNVRAQLIGLVVTMPILLGHSEFKKKCLVPVMAGGVALVGFGVVHQWEFVTQIIIPRFMMWHSFGALIISQHMRLDGWQAAIGMVKDHPVFGIGSGMWEIYNPQYTKWGLLLNQAHSLPLQYASSGGVGTFIAFSALLVVILRQAFQLWKRSEDVVVRTISLGILWSFSAYVVTGFIGGLISLSEMYLWMAVGGLFALGKMAKEWEAPYDQFRDSGWRR